MESNTGANVPLNVSAKDNAKGNENGNNAGHNLGAAQFKPGMKLLAAIGTGIIVIVIVYFIVSNAWKGNISGHTSSLNTISSAYTIYNGFNATNASSAKIYNTSNSTSYGIRIFSASSMQPYSEYQASDGNFSVSAPQGWSVSASPGDRIIDVAEQNSSFSPAYAPSAYVIAGIVVSDINYEVLLRGCTSEYIQNPYTAPSGLQCAFSAISTQLNDSSHEWNASSSLNLILGTILKNGGAGVSVISENVRQVNNTAAYYNITFSSNAQEIDELGYIIMAYLPNQMLSRNGKEGVTSVAFIMGCQIPSGGSSYGINYTCARILKSFAPGGMWLSSIAQNIMRGYNGEYETLLQGSQTQLQQQGLETQTIENFGKNMMQMQQQMFSDFQNSNYAASQDWSAALSGQVNLVDPNTGQEYSAPRGYGGYCISGNGDILAGTNISPGGGPTYDECQTVLQQT